MIQRFFFLALLGTLCVPVKAQSILDSTRSNAVKKSEYTGVYASISAGCAYQSNDARALLWPTDSVTQVYPSYFGFRVQGQLEAVIKNGIGFALKAARQTFACDNAPIVQEYQKMLPHYTWSAVSSQYLLRTFSAGLNYLYSPLSSQKVKANFKLMVGGGNVISPAVSLQGRHNDSTVTVRMDNRRTKLFTASVGLGLRYEITEVVNLSMEAELQYYDFDLGKTWGDDVVSPSLSRVKLPGERFPLGLVAMNLNFGIGFNFR